MGKLRKYPQNILFLLVFLFVCFGIIFCIREYSSPEFLKGKMVSLKNNSVSSQVKFKLKNKIVMGSKSKPLAVQDLSGTGLIDLDLINGDVKVSSVNIFGKEFDIKEINKNIRISLIKLDPAYTSSGKIDLKTGKIDLSVGVMIEMNIDKKSTSEKISLVLPLVGSLDRESGILNLSGDATIPPGKLSVPLPVEASINAISF